MDFALETARLGPFRLLCCAVRGRTGSIGRATVLLESDTEERRDDASAGDERALQRA